MFAALDIARKWSTALVDPPRTVTNLKAFSRDFFVTISEGLISFSTRFLIDLPISLHSFIFSLLIAGLDEL